MNGFLGQSGTIISSQCKMPSNVSVIFLSNVHTTNEQGENIFYYVTKIATVIFFHGRSHCNRGSQC